MFEFGITHSSCCCDSRSLVYKGMVATLVYIHSLIIRVESRGVPRGGRTVNNHPDFQINRQTG